MLGSWEKYDCLIFECSFLSLQTFLFFTDLFAVLISSGVIGDLEIVEVDYFLHLIVVPPPLADDYSDVEQKNMSATLTRHDVAWKYKQEWIGVKVFALSLTCPVCACPYLTPNGLHRHPSVFHKKVSTGSVKRHSWTDRKTMMIWINYMLLSLWVMLRWGHVYYDNLPNSQWISDIDQSPSESQHLFSPHLHTGLGPV